MGEPARPIEGDDEAERRISRARSAIGKSFEELITRGERTTGDPPSSPRVGPGGPAPDVERPPPEAGSSDELAPGSIDAITASVERRVSAWVDGRVRAAERRLELQSEAFEAALGEEAVGARRATEQAIGTLYGSEGTARAIEEMKREVGTSTPDIVPVQMNQRQEEGFLKLELLIPLKQANK